MPPVSLTRALIFRARAGSSFTSQSKLFDVLGVGDETDSPYGFAERAEARDESVEGRAHASLPAPSVVLVRRFAET